MLPARSVALAIDAFAHFLPKWTRPDVFFAMTIDPAFDKPSKWRVNSKMAA
jgi:hypothetical protein